MLFDGDAIVLAGATGRVGGATLRLLHDEGARIAVISRSQATANAAVDGLDRAFGVVADLADPDGVATALDDVAARFGRIDAVVNLAGRGSSSRSSIRRSTTCASISTVSSCPLTISRLRRCDAC